MQAHDIMVHQVHKVKESDTVRSVIEKFIDNGISGLPVVNDRNEIVGFISDGDVLRYIGKHEDKVVDSLYFAFVVKVDNEEFEDREKRLLDLNVLEIAKRKVIKVSWDEDLETIAAVLGKNKLKKYQLNVMEY